MLNEEIGPQSRHEDFKIDMVRSDEDWEGCRKLWHDVYNESFAVRRAWIYQCNPRPAALFVAKNSQGSVIGMQGVILRRMSINWMMVNAWQTVDLIISPQYRNLRIALALQKYIIRIHPEYGISFLYGFPNNKSVGVQMRAGYGELGCFDSWVKPLDVRLHLEKQKIPMSEIIAPAVNMCFWIADKSRSLFRSPNSVSDFERFDQRFVSLWDSTVVRFPIIGERGETYLNWRFAQCPGARDRLFVVNDSSSMLIGYVVYSTRERTCNISDFLAKSEYALFHLLMQFSRAMRARNIDAISLQFCGSSKIGKILMHAGFHLRESDIKILIYSDLKNGDKQFIHNRDMWYLTEADRDA